MTRLLIILCLVTFTTKAQIRQNSIDSLFIDFEGTQTPGASVLVIKEGKKVYEKSFGFADLENRIPAAQNTNYRLASVTKQFTATCIMMLVERHKISLNDPLIKFIVDFPPYARNIFIRNLLNHSSGIADYDILIPKGTTRPLSDTDVLNLIKSQDTTYFKPGERFEYSNSAYVLLGLIVGKVSGMPFKDFLKENIFSPLKMDHTSINDPVAVIPNRAYGYSGVGNKFVKTDQSLTSYTLGDGGIYTSAEDLYKWDQSIYSSQLLKESTLQQMFTISNPFDKKNPSSGYGFGWFIDENSEGKLIYHGGNSMGFTTYLAKLPEKKLSIIILTNRTNSNLKPIMEKLAIWFTKG